MTKISLIAIIWVWNCVAYGQLSANNPYYFPYIPYTSTFVTHQSHSHQNYDKTVDQSAGNAGELLGRGIPFQIALFIKMQDLEATTADLAKQLKDLKDELETKATKDDLAKKADQSQLDQTNSELLSARTELTSTTSEVKYLTIELLERTSEIVNIGRIPGSCSDLQQIGHKLSGLFTVRGLLEMESVYCNFYSNGTVDEKRIGYVDIKSAPVYFHVMSKSSFSTKNIPIPYDLPLVNEGNAMNVTSGIFTVPRTGTYFFSFGGVAEFSASPIFNALEAVLVMNDAPLGGGYVSVSKPSGFTLSPLSLQMTLKLRKGDKVCMALTGTTGIGLTDISSSLSPLTHFTGTLLEEEIVASL